MVITLGQRANIRRLRAGVGATVAIGLSAAAIGLAAAFGVTRVSTAVIIVAALVLGGLFTAIILGRWYLGLILVFIEAPFDDLIRRFVYFGRQVPHLDPIHLVAEFMVFSVALGIVLDGIVHRRVGAAPRQRKLLLLATSLYFAYLVVQIFNPLNGNILIGAQGFVSIGYYILLLFVAPRVIRTPQALRLLLTVSVLCATLVALYGIFQHVRGLTPQDKFELQRLELLIGKRSYLYYGSEVRVFSTLGTYSACASYLCVNFIIATYLLLRGSPRIRLLAATAMPLMALCLLWTYSRTNWLGASVGVMLVFALLRPWRPQQKAFFLAFLLLLGIALFGLLGQLGQSSIAMGNPVLQRFGQLTNGEGETSLSQRVSELGYIVRYSRYNPLGAGVGANLPNTAGNTGAAKVANVNNDNYYFLLLFEIGYPGLALFLVLSLGFVVVGLKNHQRARYRDVKGLGAVLVTIVITLLFLSLGEPFLQFGGTVEYFWLAAGLLISLPEMDACALREAAAQPGGISASGGDVPARVVVGAGRAQ